MKGSFRIGEWVVHSSLGILTHPEGEIHLEPRAMEVLVYLSEHAGEVVTKERIFQDVWEGAFVTDEALTNCISLLRKSLGDDPRSPRFIQTIPKKGYRLIAPVAAEILEPPAGVEPERSPYPGLSPFSEENAEYFFGREEEVESLREKLTRRRLLALIGASGAGKTSLLRAGLLSALPAGWRAVLCQPGDRPWANMARALVPEVSGDTEATEGLLRFEEPEVAVSVLERWRRTHTEVVVVVDQFEELFTLNPKEVRSRFAEVLGRAVSEVGVRVLLSLRDDFLIRCHDYEALSDIFTELTPLKPPEGKALRRALVGPAERCGHGFEDEELVEAILADVSEELGALPLLAFAAARLWEKRDRERGLLTREAYEGIGGVGGALARHAEATLERIGPEHLSVVREIFRNLVTAQGTRAARDKGDLLSAFGDRTTAEGVLAQLINARLLTSFEIAGGDGERAHHRVEIVHESLLSAWPRLVRWQAQDAEGALLRDQLRQAAQLWHERGRPTDLLWTGTSFKEFQLWRERYPGGLTGTEEGFAQAMVGQAARRRKRRRINVSAAMALLAVGVGVVTALWRQSVAETRRAEASKLLALGQLELERYPTAAVAYALASLELADTRDGRTFALRALQKGPTEFKLSMDDVMLMGGGAYELDFSPDGQWLALGGFELVQLRPRNGGPPILIRRYPTSDRVPAIPRFSQEGDRLVTLKKGQLQFFTVPEGKELGSWTIEPGPSALVMTSKGYFTSATVGDEEVVRAGVLDGEEPRIVGRVGAFFAGDIDPDGKRLLYAQDQKLFLRSFEDRESTPQIVGEHPSEISDVRFHPDGSRVAALDTSGEIRLWSVAGAGAETLRTFPGSGLEGVAFDHSGTRLAAFGSPDGLPTVKVWQLNKPLEAEPLTLRRMGDRNLWGSFDPSDQWFATTGVNSVTFWPVHRDFPLTFRYGSGVFDVAFAPDGKSLLASGGGVRRWLLEGNEGSGIVLGEGRDVEVDPLGRFILVSGVEGHRVFVVPLDGDPARELEGFSSACLVWEAIAVDTGGRLAAAALKRGPAEEKVIRIWDLESGDSRVLGPVEGAGDGIVGNYYSLKFLPDGRLLAYGICGLWLWNLEDGTATKLAEGEEGRMASSRDGRHVLYTRSLDYNARLAELAFVDLVSGDSRRLLTHGTSALSVAFDPTGNLAVTGDWDGVVRVGPVTGEEPHLLLGHEGAVYDLDVSPDGRWIASAGEDRTVRLWPMPKGPPFHTLPHEEILERLRSVTNLRVDPDEASSTGYRLDYAPFPGWEKVPEW